MSSYSPPIENNAIFDSTDFSSGETTLTQSAADKRYLRYPNAQGTENLQAINVNGLSTFNSRATITSSDTSNSVLNIATTSSFTNNGLNMTNCSIQQTGGNIGFVTNNLTNTKLLTGASLVIGSGANLQMDATDLPNSLKYNLTSSGGSSLNLIQNLNGTNTTLLTVNKTTNITTPVPILSTATIPASNDSSTRVPTTAWVQGAITAGAGGPNLTKNSYTVSPTSTALMPTSGITNFYNTGGRFSFTSTDSYNFGGSVGWGLNEALRINIQIANGTEPYNSVAPHYPTFSPLIRPIKVKLNCFVYNTSGATAYTRCTLMLLPSCMFGTGANNYWGRYGNNTGNTLYALDNRINGNTAFNNTDATYCPYPANLTPTSGVNPDWTGRQYYSYDYSSSSNTTILGMTYIAGGKCQIIVWFGGIGSGSGTSTNTITYCVDATIEDAGGATGSPNTCAVFLSQ